MADNHGKQGYDMNRDLIDDIEKQIHPTEADLKAYYEQHKSQYTNSIPEKRKVRYILVDTAKLKDQVQVTPQDLQNYYNQHREEYRVPDQVEVRHIKGDRRA